MGAAGGVVLQVKLVFQPAEEDTGGAGPMIEAGVLDAPKVDAALALHIMNEVECGKVRVRQGAVMASRTSLT